MIWIQRREFITLLGGAAAGWPLAARAQQSEQVRRMGILMGAVESDQSAQASIAAMRQALAELGWIEGRNLRTDLRWAGGDRDILRKYAAELVALQPDIIVTTGSGGVGPLQQATRTLPIVFTSVIDPVAGGFVAGLSRPGGNTTGFTSFDYGLAGKWPELLKQIAPAVTRTAVLRDPTQFAGGGQLGAIQAVAPFFGTEGRLRRRGDRVSAKPKRREFIAMLGGAAAWPGSVWAQQDRRTRRIGGNDPHSCARQVRTRTCHHHHRGQTKCGPHCNDG